MEINGKNQHADRDLAVVLTMNRDLDRHPVVAKKIKELHVLVGLIMVIVKVNTHRLWQKIVPKHVVKNEDKL